jgi:hypothetical protein
MIGQAVRYLHPYLTITPDRGMTLSKGISNVA